MKTNKRLLWILSFSVFLPASLSLASCNDVTSSDSNNSSSVDAIYIQNPFKEVYGVGSIIDFENITFVIKLNGTTLNVNGLDSRLKIEGGDTENVGKHQIKVTFMEKTFSFEYEVKQFYLTLDFNSGTYQDQSSVKLPLYNNRASISEYVPTHEDEESPRSFSGWYYDRNCENRAAFALEKEIKSESDLTLYAGYDAYYDDVFSYVIDSTTNTATLLSLNFEEIDFSILFDTTLYIPSTIKGYPITEIGSDFLIQKTYDSDGGYYENDYAAWMVTEKIVFGENSYVEKIGDRAFRNLSSLTSVEFPSSLLSIGTEAFSATSLTGDIVFNKSLSKIGSEAFSYDTKLTGISFEEGSKIKIIGEGAFSGDEALNKVSLPNGLDEIRDEAFSNCNDLSSIYIPASISIIGSGAFKYMSSLSEIIVDENNKNYTSLDGNLYSKNMEKLIRYCYKDNEQSFIVPESVVSISDSAFTLFGDFCTLTELKLGEGISYIGKEAFSNCTFDLNLPKSLNSFSLDAFKGYAGKNITVSEGNDRYLSDDGILFSKDYSTLFSCPGAYECTHFVLDDKVKTISNSAFYKCTEISSFKISKDSSLEEVEKKGILLSSMESLKYLELDKVEGITFKKDSLTCSTIYSNDSYIVITPDEESKTSFLSQFSEGNVLVSKTYIKGEMSSKAKGAVEECVEIAFANFTSGNGDLLNTIDVLQDKTKKAISMTAYMFDNGVEDEKEYSYYENFYKNIYLSVYAQTFLDENYSLTNNGACVARLNNAYKALPNTIKEEVKPLLEKMNEKFKYLNNEDSLNELYKDILNFKADRNTFDRNSFALIKQRAEALQLQNSALPTAVYQKYLLLHIDSVIDEALKVDLDHASTSKLNELYELIEPCQENNYSGIYTLICSYFDNDYRKGKIYRYDEFEIFFDKFEKKFAEQENIVKEEIENFDLTTFDYDKYLDFYENKVLFLQNRFLSVYYEVQDKANLIYLNLAINEFHEYDDSLSEDNFVEAFEFGSDISDCLDVAGEEGKKVNDYSYFLEAKKKADTFAKEYASSFTKMVDSFELKKENLTKEKIEVLYYSYAKFSVNEENVASDLLDKSTIEKYSTIIVSYLINDILNRFPSITKENFYYFKKCIKGFYSFERLEKIEGYEDYINNYLSEISDYSLILGYDSYEQLLSSLASLESF